MKKLSNFLYFLITFILLTYGNLYISDMLYDTIQKGIDFQISFLNLTYAKNTGAAFSIMQNSKAFLIALSIIALLVIVSYILHNIKSLSKKTILFLSFLVSGILGNLVERIEYGYVRDFFEFTFCNFPIFNISDIFITVGVIGIVIRILFSRKPIKLL